MHHLRGETIIHEFTPKPEGQNVGFDCPTQPEDDAPDICHCCTEQEGIFLCDICEQFTCDICLLDHPYEPGMEICRSCAKDVT